MGTLPGVLFNHLADHSQSHAASMGKPCGDYWGTELSTFRVLGIAEIYASSAGNAQMVSIVCVVVHPSRLAREGLKAILAKSPFAPICTSSSIEEVPSIIAGAGEQVLVLIGIRDAAHLAQAFTGLCAGLGASCGAAHHP